MTREELTSKFLTSTSNHFVLQLPTSYGKSYMALQKANQWYKKDCKILIVIPRNVLIDNWKDEIKKWKYNKMLPNITFTTYVSLPKHCGNHWDICICDEAHHTSERCQDAMRYLDVTHFIGLSATLKKEILFFFTTKFHPEIIKVAVKDAIESSVLPDPKIILIPIKLDNITVNQVIKKNIKKNTDLACVKTIGYAEKWKYKGYKGPLHILCTQRQYYNDISNLIEWYKKNSSTSARMKNMWLHKAGERLKWLAEQKKTIVKELLKELKNYRVLTFCQSIEQSETLGCPCVNSKIGTANLEKFNAKKIKHIASIDMLNEGLNPVDCKIGLFQMINSSQRLSIQKIGRILRHKEPVLIFPYFIESREEEIIKEIVQDYNPELIIRLNASNISNIKNYMI